MKIGFTYDLRSDYKPADYAPSDYYGEFETEETVSSIVDALRALGHDVTQIGDLESLVSFLAAGNSVDLVFNMAEGRYGRAREAQVPGILEACQIPYTFSDPLTLAICLDKGLTKQILQSAHIPTPEYLVLPPNASLDMAQISPLGWPLFLKPNCEGTSKGIDEKAIVDSEPALLKRVEWLWGEYKQSVLVEKYLPRREFTVGVLGTDSQSRVLGIAEITLIGKSKVYGFVEKEECESLVSYTAVDNNDLVEELSKIALAAWRLLNCRDGGRVDLRLDENGRAHVLEINTLPGLHHTHSDLPIIAAQEGVSYLQLIDEILSHAAQRMR